MISAMTGKPADSRLAGALRRFEQMVELCRSFPEHRAVDMLTFARRALSAPETDAAAALSSPAPESLAQLCREPAIRKLRPELHRNTRVARIASARKAKESNSAKLPNKEPVSRAVVADRIANMRQGERTDLEHSAILPKVSRDEAAERLHVSERAVAADRIANMPLGGAMYRSAKLPSDAVAAAELHTQEGDEHEHRMASERNRPAPVRERRAASRKRADPAARRRAESRRPFSCGADVVRAESEPQQAADAVASAGAEGRVTPQSERPRARAWTPKRFALGAAWKWRRWRFPKGSKFCWRARKRPA